MNFLQIVPQGMRFIKAIDASGNTKDANYQAKFVLDCMDESGGSHLYTVLFFDGACKASFPLIEAKAKHLTCLIDCSHSIDRFVGNVCSNKPKITIKGEDPLDWDVSCFHDTAVDVWYVIKAIYAQERPLYLYREIVKRSNGKYNEMRKFCVTRYCSQVFMMVRYKKNYPVLQELLSSVAFKDWLGKQNKQIKVRFERVARIVNAQDHPERVDTFIQVLGKAAELVRLCDGMKGVYLGTVRGGPELRELDRGRSQGDQGAGRRATQQAPQPFLYPVEVLPQGRLHGRVHVTSGLPA